MQVFGPYSIVGHRQGPTNVPTKPETSSRFSRAAQFVRSTGHSVATGHGKSFSRRSTGPERPFAGTSVFLSMGSSSWRQSIASIGVVFLPWCSRESNTTGNMFSRGDSSKWRTTLQLCGNLSQRQVSSLEFFGFGLVSGWFQAHSI